MNLKKNLSKMLAMVLMVSILTGFATTGCKTFTSTSYKSLSIAGDTGTEVMRIIISLYKQGFVSDSEYTAAREVYIKYKAVYDGAVEALASYKAVENQGTQATVVSALAELTALAAKLSAMLSEFQERQNAANK